MKRPTAKALPLSVAGLLILLWLFANVVGSWLSPQRSLASSQGDALLYLPFAQAPPRPIPTATSPAPGETVLVGAGDIAECDLHFDEATADLLDAIPGTVFTTGDNAYGNGTPQEFQECYDPSWGRHKARTMPSPGNHDYGTDNAAGYFGYFGPAAGNPDNGYYSYDRGQWHIVALNSNCNDIDAGCDAGSPQEQWLRQDLAANPRMCTLAYFHHPLFSSGSHGGSASVLELWQALYDFGADVVLNGHDHNYERFAPQDPAGNADPESGIRQFVVGTGGTDLRNAGPPVANSEVLDAETHGVLKLTLHSTSYDWEFVPVAGETFGDAGSDDCH